MCLELNCVWLFFDPMDCSSPGSSVHGNSQARENTSPGDFSNPGIEPMSSALQPDSLPLEPSGILAWRIPWTEEPGGLQSMGLQRVVLDWATNTHTWIEVCQLITHKKRKEYLEWGPPKCLRGRQMKPCKGEGRVITKVIGTTGSCSARETKERDY